MYHFNNAGLLIPGSDNIDKNSNAARLYARSFELMSDEELLSRPIGDLWVVDVESYYNYFLIGFRPVNEKKYVLFEQSTKSSIYYEKLLWMLWRFTTIGFNSINFDIPIIFKAVNGCSCEDLKKFANDIINNKWRLYQIQRILKMDIPLLRDGPCINHLDLIELCPGIHSLKLYSGRIHCKNLQDLPFHHEQTLNDDEIIIVRAYNCIDLDDTVDVFNEQAKAIQLRLDMSKEYNIDLRSKSDAQIAEAVIKSELTKAGIYVKKPGFVENASFKYNIPHYIKFQSKYLNKIVDEIGESTFFLSDKGKLLEPPALYNRLVKIGNTVYKLGLGGLHSQEKNVYHVSDENTIIADNDVASYYPNIILNQGLYPSHLGEKFLEVYQHIVDTRLKAKDLAKKADTKEERELNELIANSLKITINGSFGKFGEQHSVLYSPQFVLQTTISGQLTLLMLIEALTDAGIEVISGNTDGIVSKYPKERHNDVRAIIRTWEEQTGFETEETRYKALYSWDVNTYIAVKFGDGDHESSDTGKRLNCKTKGRLSSTLKNMSIAPSGLICVDALLEYLVNGTPFAETIINCKDIRRFVYVKNVTGGGYFKKLNKEGVYLGKVVRWYYSNKDFGEIRTVNKNSLVGGASDCKPLMDLPNELPDDINYQKYIDDSVDLLYSIGVLKKPTSKKLKLFFKD